jgi:hypothetical protein
VGHQGGHLQGRAWSDIARSPLLGLESFAEDVQNDLMGLLHRSRIEGRHASGGRNDDRDVALPDGFSAIASEKSDHQTPLALRDCSGAGDVGTPTAGRKENEHVRRGQEGLTGAGEDVLKAEIVRDAGEPRWIGCEANGSQGRAVGPVAPDQLLSQVEGFCGRAPVSSGVEGASGRQPLGDLLGHSVDDWDLPIQGGDGGFGHRNATGRSTGGETGGVKRMARHGSGVYGPPNPLSVE